MIHIKDMIILNVMRELSSFRNEASNLKGGVPTGINYFNAILLINSIIFYMLPKRGGGGGSSSFKFVKFRECEGGGGPFSRCGATCTCLLEMFIIVLFLQFIVTKFTRFAFDKFKFLFWFFLIWKREHLYKIISTLKSGLFNTRDTNCIALL